MEQSNHVDQFDIVVECKNDPTYDIAAVQAAIIEGRHILLKNTCNFGQYGRVVVTTDHVVISGEEPFYVESMGEDAEWRSDNNQWVFDPDAGSHKKVWPTRIEGGSSPLFIGADFFVKNFNILDPNEFGAGLNDPEIIVKVNNVTIQNLHFHNSYASGITVVSSQKDLTIKNNHFTDGRMWTLTGPAGESHFHKGLLTAGGGMGPTTYDPGLISGTIKVTGNYFNGMSLVTESSFEGASAGYGGNATLWVKGSDIAVDFHHQVANIEVNNNVIINILDTGLRIQGYDLFSKNNINTKKTFNIQNNYISPGNAGVNYEVADGNGITIIGEYKKAKISNNMISCSHDNGLGICLIQSRGAVIEENEIIGVPLRWGVISMIGNCNQNRIQNNRISGQGLAGILLGDLLSRGPLTKNSILENEFRNFSPLPTTLGAAFQIAVVWNSHDNIISGNLMPSVDDPHQIAHILFAAPYSPLDNSPSTSGNKLAGAEDDEILTIWDWTNGENIIDQKDFEISPISEDTKSIFSERISRFIITVLGYDPNN